MILYLIASYIIMFVWCLKWVFADNKDIKNCIKTFAFAPATLPFILLAKFLSW
jgi:hypothetical protein